MAKFNSIGSFIDFKYDYDQENSKYIVTDAYRTYQDDDVDRFNDHPIHFIDNDGSLNMGFLQDVQCSIETQDDTEIHIVAAKVITTSKIITFRKICTAPRGCRIKWSDVACAWDLEIEN